MQTVGGPTPGKAKDLFDVMYPGNTASCYVCHSTNTRTPTPTPTPYGTMYKENGGTKVGTMSALHAIEDLDADNDGINNGLEIRLGTDPNVANAAPGIIGTDATNGDILLSGSNITSVQVTPVQDLYSEFGVSLPAGQQLLGNAQFSYQQSSISPVTVAFTKASGYGTVKVYEQTSVGTSQEIPSTITSLGNITFTATSTNPKIAIESTIDPMEPASSGGGCLSMPSMPLGMLVLLVTIMLLKRTKHGR